MEHRPSPFKPIDIVAFIIPISISILCAVLALVANTNQNNYNPATMIVAKVVSVIVAIVFIGIYSMVLAQRISFINTFNISLPYGIMVRTNGYITSYTYMSASIEAMVLKYQSKYPNAKELLNSENTWVTFIPGVIKESFGYKVKLAGVTIGDDISVGFFKYVNGQYVSWPEAPLSSTAFIHELQHVIVGRATNNWDNDTHHKIMLEIDAKSA